MVRKQMNVNNFSLNYNQMGLIATVELDEECDENFVAWQRFLPNGVIALLPLSTKLSSIVWSTETKHFKHLMQLNDADFIDAVNNAFVSIPKCVHHINVQNITSLANMACIFQFSSHPTSKISCKNMKRVRWLKRQWEPCNRYSMEIHTSFDNCHRK